MVTAEKRDPFYHFIRYSAVYDTARGFFAAAPVVYFPLTGTYAEKQANKILIIDVLGYTLNMLLQFYAVLTFPFIVVDRVAMSTRSVFAFTASRPD
jgi:hypothetical protein